MKKAILAICLAVFVLSQSPTVSASEAPLETLSVSAAVATALKNNPSIRVATANMAAADESVKSARADLLPKISAGYGYTALKEEPIMKTAGGDLQIAHQNQYNWDVTLVQPLFAGFALRSQYDIAKLDTVSRELEKEQTVLDLTRGVRSACYNLMLAQKLLEVSSDEVETLTAHKKDAELFFSQGLIPPNDRLKADVALSNALQQQARVKASVRKAVIRINRLLDRPLESGLAIEDAAAISQETYDLEVLSARALKGRPVLRLVDVSMEQLGLAKKAAQSTWYPQLSLVGSYEKTGDNPAADNNEFSNSDGSYVGVQAQWNFWESGKTRAETNRVRRQMKALEARIEALQAQVLEEVRSALLDCRVAHANITTAEKALDQARENWRITDLQYQQQVATSTDVLDARTFLTQADTNYYRALYGYLDAVAGLERAVGRKGAADGNNPASPEGS